MSDYKKQLRKIQNKHSKNPLIILSEIKKQVNPGEFENAINTDFRLKNFKTTNLKFSDILGIKQRDALVFTSDIKRELFWLFYNFKQEAVFLNSFLQNKADFEKLFILCQYDAAQDLLNEIRKNFGESLWTLEMTLLLKEYQFETKENWVELSNFLTQIKSPFYQFVINFYSKRIEENMSFENCFILFQNDFNGVNTYDYVRDFIVFKCLFIANFEYCYENLDSVLYISNIYGVIDQYLITIEVLMRLVSQNSNNDKTLIQFTNKINTYITNDYRLSNILNLIDKKTDIILLHRTAVILPIIDTYTRGNFADCLILCTNELKEFPLSFELYELYVKSLHNLNLGFKPTDISSFVDKILEVMFKTLLYDKDSEKHRNKLMKYAISFLSFDFGKQLYAFAAGLGNDINANMHTLISCLSSSINNPRVFSLNLNKRESLAIEKFKSFQQSDSFKINEFIKGCRSISEILIKNDIQSITYQARYYFNQSDFQKVIELTEPFIEQKQLSLFYYDNIIFLLSESYLKTNQLVAAMALSANIIADRVFYTNKLNIHGLVAQVKHEGIDKYTEYIDVPILFSLISKEYDLYEVYIEFMLCYEEEYPSKLDVNSLVNKFSLKKIIYFLKEVCTISTMAYSLEFNSINEVEQERCSICGLLKELDPENKAYYDDEVAEILKSIAVRKALKEVNQGRLFVNIEGLKNIQMNNIKESFMRYKELEITSKHKGLIGFNVSKEMNWDSQEYISKKSDAKFNDPAFLAFKSIYFETRERFLFNKAYGLDSCLSTNYRHGSVKNHIRSVFEKHNLITSKNNDKYIDNLYWVDKIAPHINNDVQEKLKKFSEEIDNYTKEIIDNFIQIQTERHTEKKNGIFNYSTKEEILWLFFQEHKERFFSVEAILDIIYVNFINHTIYNVYTSIYSNIVNVITKKYQKIIECLSKDLKNIGIGNECDLLHNVSKSSTNIQQELEDIAEGFYLNTTNSASLLDIETIIYASKEYVNGINPYSCINPEVNVWFPMPAYSTLIFVFNILFTNIIKHSGLNSSNVKVIINVFMPKNDYVEIQVINNISETVDTNNIRNKLQKVKDNWNNHENIERSNIEGGSGFDKIKRLLLYEVIAKTDRFEFSITPEKVTISLFLPVKRTMINIENIMKVSVEIIKKRICPNDMNHEIDVTQLDCNYSLSNNFISVFSLILNNLTKYSKVNNIFILCKVIKKSSDNFIEFRFSNMFPNNGTIININILEQIKNEWHIFNLKKEITNDFDTIKELLFDEGVLSNSSFEYLVNNNGLSISLFLPFNQYDNA
ncbi:MAG: hypothetical protein JNM36_02245 [Chitinophagales bacterium]|nr:hypothetical protein [Chitinophagales bacterium]